MKRRYTFLTLLILCLSAEDGKAQDEYREYIPFLEEGKEWVIYNDYYIREDDDFKPIEEREPYRTYMLRGDTIVHGKSYKKLYAMCERIFGDKNIHYFSALREENRKVYRIPPDSSNEKMLYDFEQGIDIENSFTYSIDGVLFPELEGRILRINIKDIYIVDERQVRQGEVCLDDVPEKNWISGIYYIIEGVGELIDPFLTELWSSNIYIIDFENMNHIFVKDSKGIYDANYLKYLKPENNNFISFPLDKYNKFLFDLQGRRLTQEPQQGVFIRNGRKVVKGN